MLFCFHCSIMDLVFDEQGCVDIPPLPGIQSPPGWRLQSLGVRIRKKKLPFAVVLGGGGLHTNDGLCVFKAQGCLQGSEKKGSFWFTLPETNSSPVKIGHPKRKLVFQLSIFRGYVGFRESDVGILGLQECKCRGRNVTSLQFNVFKLLYKAHVSNKQPQHLNNKHF